MEKSIMELKIVESYEKKINESEDEGAGEVNDADEDNKEEEQLISKKSSLLKISMSVHNYQETQETP